MASVPELVDRTLQGKEGVAVSLQSSTAGFVHILRVTCILRLSCFFGFEHSRVSMSNAEPETPATNLNLFLFDQ